MPIVLSHNSALAAMRAFPPQANVLQPVQAPMSLAHLSPSAHELASIDSNALCLARPIHVLSAVSKGRARAEGAIVHTPMTSELPAKSLLRIAEDLYTCSPELAFIQMSQTTGLLGRVVLAHELCGRYSHFARLISGFYDRSPLTSVDRLLSACEAFKGMNGVGKARKALQWARDESRSPMETVVSACLFLPGRLGGFGFAAPTLNYRVTLDAVAANITHTKTCAVDASWPALRVGLEYDSSAFHADAEKDQRRREALVHMGWTIFTLNLDEMTDYRALRHKVGLFADLVPRQRGRQASEGEQRDLLKRLLAATRFGLGMDAALFGASMRRGSVEVHL